MEVKWEVVLMLSVIERELAVTHSMEYFSNPPGMALFKILASFLSNTTELNKELSGLTEDIFKDKERMQICAKRMIEYMANVANQSAPCTVYTTGQLARFFGVSITTINNWITEGRFIGMPQRDKNKQARIPEYAMWKSSNGDLISIREVIGMYNMQNAELASKEEEIKDIKASIQFFEKKYNGPYEKVLLRKENKTEEELRDESEWKYLLRRLEA